MRHRIAGLLLLAAAFFAEFGCIGQNWAQDNIRHVGILTFIPITDDSTRTQWFEAFRGGLAAQGWTEGKNIAFVYRSAENDPLKFASAAAELAALKVDIIFAVSAPAVRAAYSASRNIPIIAIDYTSDPVAEGYAKSYRQPGGIITGVFLDAPEYAGKSMEFLKSLVPTLSHAVVLWDPGPGDAHLKALQHLAKQMHLKLQVIEVRKPDDIESAFLSISGRPQALVILPSPIIFRESERLANLALDHRLPAISIISRFARAGGLLTYEPDGTSAYESCGLLAAKVLNGARTADLPLERPSRIVLAVNMKTAKALGITIPQSILLRADEVIR